jgi:ATP-dependent Lon protease
MTGEISLRGLVRPVGGRGSYRLTPAECAATTFSLMN